MLEHMAEESEDEEKDLRANVAGEESGSDEEHQSASEGEEDADSDDGVSALVACALKNLVKD